MLAFLELKRFTPIQEAKASRKFGVLCSFRYESNQNRLFYKTMSRIFKYLKSYWDFTSFGETQAKETFDKDFKTMKN